MKVAKKREVFDAVKFEPGMEDGYYCYEITGQFLGAFPKNGYMPRVVQRPYIDTPKGKYEMSKGDWVLVDSSGNRYRASPVEFDEIYEQIEPTKEVTTIVRVYLGEKEILKHEIPGAIDHTDVRLDLNTVEK